MATSYQRRPDGKAPDPKAVARRDPALDAELQRVEERKKALEQRKEDGALDADLAARLQPQMGNAAIAGLLNRATDTASSGADASLEEKRNEKDEEKEEEGEEKEAGEVEHVLPSFSTAGGGGGGGQPPWAMGHLFGGDDDADPEVVQAEGPRWRPMAVLPDPDEDAELEEVDPDAPPDPDAVDLRGAADALGDAPWRPTVLSRGLRYSRSVARRDFGPEALVDSDGPEHALGRGRAILRFVAKHGDGLDAVLIARAGAGAGTAAFPTAGGYAGATARALALAEIALASLPPGWPGVLDVALDPRARARVEGVASEVAEEVGLAAVALFEKAVGLRAPPSPVELTLDAHPAGLVALERAGRFDPLPLVDLWSMPERLAKADAAVEALDAILARFTGGEPAPGDTIQPADLSALFGALNQLLSAMGATLVELAAAAVACAPHVPAGQLTGVLAEADHLLKRAARRLYATGDALGGVLNTKDAERARASSAEAIAVRSTVELARQSAAATLSRFLLDTEPAPPELPEAYARAEEAIGAGRTEAARALLDEAVASAPPELEGRVLLAAGALLLRAGLPEEGRLAEAAARSGGGVLGAGARSLAAGLALAEEDWSAAGEHARAETEIGLRRGMWYVFADGACAEASALGRSGGDWREPLLRAGHTLRAQGEGGALNLLKARWGEIEAEKRAVREAIARGEAYSPGIVEPPRRRPPFG